MVERFVTVIARLAEHDEAILMFGILDCHATSWLAMTIVSWAYLPNKKTNAGSAIIPSHSDTEYFVYLQANLRQLAGLFVVLYN